MSPAIPLGCTSHLSERRRPSEVRADLENKLFEAVREGAGQAHIQQMEESAERNSKLIVAASQTDPDVARAIHALSDAYLVRLKALARLWARGLPKGLSWSDVLHEAIARGSRRWVGRN
jgi:hypothetical protein